MFPIHDPNKQNTLNTAPLGFSPLGVNEATLTIKSVPQVTPQLTWQDRLGGCKVRWGIGRNAYRVEPGLYALGHPTETSPVIVTANYKLTFDAVRSALPHTAVWLLVLDTKGVNVWCAAGKGTFGTSELVNRILSEKLAAVVTHKEIIVPQLGAPGIASHEIKRCTGFKVIYGPIRATDLEDFFRSGQSVTPDMRQVKFTLYDRLVLTPVEWVNSMKMTLRVFGVFFLLNLMGVAQLGLLEGVGYLAAVFAGTVLTPIALPLLPSRAFSVKGYSAGMICLMLWLWISQTQHWVPSVSLLEAAGLVIGFSSVSGYYGLNFTGSSTYTSMTGVEKEMRLAIPALLGSAIIGALMYWIGAGISI